MTTAKPEVLIKNATSRTCCSLTQKSAILTKYHCTETLRQLTTVSPFCTVLRVTEKCFTYKIEHLRNNFVKLPFIYLFSSICACIPKTSLRGLSQSTGQVLKFII